MLIYSLLNLLLSILPVLIYLGIISITIPFGSINFKKSVIYFLCGFVSITLIIFFLTIFPNSRDLVCPPFSILGDEFSDSLFIRNFIQVGFMEEFFKFIGFFIASMLYSKSNSPISTMIYCGIVALGYSFMENVEYVMMYDSSIIFMRSIGAMILHFSCGLIMGYWIALAQMKSSQSQSILGVFMKKYKWLKYLLFSFCGIFFASSLHGLFDYNLSMDMGITQNITSIIILMLGIFITYVCGRNLMGKTNQD